MRLNLLLGLLIVVLVFLQYRLWFEDGGMRETLALKGKLKHQLAENKKLKSQNEELLFEIMRLKNSHDSAETRARDELGMIKKGEVFYQTVK